MKTSFSLYWFSQFDVNTQTHTIWSKYDNGRFDSTPWLFPVFATLFRYFVCGRCYRLNFRHLELLRKKKWIFYARFTCRNAKITPFHILAQAWTHPCQNNDGDFILNEWMHDVFIRNANFASNFNQICFLELNNFLNYFIERRESLFFTFLLLNATQF